MTDPYPRYPKATPLLKKALKRHVTVPKLAEHCDLSTNGLYKNVRGECVMTYETAEKLAEGCPDIGSAWDFLREQVRPNPKTRKKVKAAAHG